MISRCGVSRSARKNKTMLRYINKTLALVG
jgi:hypothetical protein